MIFLNNFLYKNTGEISCNISEIRNIEFPDNLLFRRVDLYNIIAKHLLKHYKTKIRNRSIFMILFAVLSLSHLFIFSIDNPRYYSIIGLFYFLGVIFWLFTSILLIDDKICMDEVIKQHKRLQHNMNELDSDIFYDLEFKMRYFMFETYHITLDIPNKLTDRIIKDYKIYEDNLS